MQELPEAPEWIFARDSGVRRDALAVCAMLAHLATVIAVTSGNGLEALRELQNNVDDLRDKLNAEPALHINYDHIAPPADEEPAP